MERVYFDHNATTPLLAELLPQLPAMATEYGNPSSIHWAGQGAKALVQKARRSVASLIGAEPLEIIFTAGGSEANNMAMKGVYEADKSKRHFIISGVEHPSVRATAGWLRDQGAEVDVLPVRLTGNRAATNRVADKNVTATANENALSAGDSTLAIDPKDLKNLLRPETALVSVMLANNETGHIFPVGELAKITHEAGALFHCDAVQALGKIPVDVRRLGADLVSFSAHKLGALKGVGALYQRRGVALPSLIHGGGQERGRRAGTENLLGITSFGYACDHVNLEESKTLMALRDRLESGVSDISGVAIIGKNSLRLPNTSCLVVDGVDGETLLMNLDLEGFAVSSGAACSSGSTEPSPVLLAMGLTRSQAQSSMRVSFGQGNTLEQVEAFLTVLSKVVKRIRGFAGAR